MNVSSIYGMFFLKISWPYACMKQHEASSPHPECYIFPVQHVVSTVIEMFSNSIEKLC